MLVSVCLFSEKKGELNKFLSKFYNTDLNIYKNLKWEKDYKNPIELAEIVGVFADNYDDYSLSMWVSLDKNIFVSVNKYNADDLIKYLYERFPY